MEIGNKTGLKLIITVVIVMLAMFVFNTNIVKATETTNGNSSDEEYVKNLELVSPRYYEVDLSMIPPIDSVSDEEWEKYHNRFFDIIGEYYTKQANDSTVVIKANAEAGGTDGGINEWTWETGTDIYIYKNGILYDTRTMGDEFTVPVIDVPYNVADDKLNDYIISTIKEYNEDIANNITEIVEGAKVKVDTKTEVEIPNGYTIYLENDRNTSYIIVNRETEPTPITKTDTKTNIKLDTTTEVVPEGTTLVAEKVTSGTSYNTVVKALGSDVSKFEMYDINLMSNNAKIQPNGKVKVSIPVPSGYDTSKLVVYRVDELGNKTEYTVTVENGYATFETDHFSNYVLAEKTDTTSTEEEQNTVIEPEQENTEHVLDNEPKTGIIDIKLFIGIALIILVIGIVGNKKKDREV